MSNCRDNCLGAMLHGYELDLLTDEDRRAFEVHVLECDHCFERLNEFRHTARLLNLDPDVKRVAQRPRVGGAAGPTGQLWSGPVRVALTLAAVLVVLILQPWEIQIRPTQEAFASERRLLVLPFENLADGADSSQIEAVVTNLLITSLTQSGSIDIVSSSRLYDLARMMDLASPDDLTDDLGLVACERSNSAWLMLGKVVSNAPRWVLTAQLIEAATGDVVSSFEAQGQPDDDIFMVVDKLGREVTSHFGAAEIATNVAVPVSSLSSSSLEAYRHYLTGTDLIKKYDFDGAIDQFQTALRIDPTMPMAYYYLGRYLDRSLMQKAMEYIDRAGVVEQHYIRYWSARYQDRQQEAVEELKKVAERFPQEKEARLLLALNARSQGRDHKARDYCKEVLALDPLNKTAYNELAYIYDRLGFQDSALWAAGRYVAVAHDEPNPHDTQGDLYAQNGFLRQAIESYRQALAIDPNYHHSRMQLGFMLLFDGQYQQADSCFAALSFQSNSDLRYADPMYALYHWLHRGKLDSALIMIDKYEELLHAGLGREAIGKRPRIDYLRTAIYREQGNLETAIEQILQARHDSENLPNPDSLGYRCYHIQLLAESGDLEAARQELEAFRQHTAKFSIKPYSLWYAEAMLALHEGNCVEAREGMAKASERRFNFFVRSAVAEVDLACGDFAEAADRLEQLDRRYDSERAFYGIEAAKLYYYLGQAYEGLGEIVKAREQYETFLHLWKDADPELTALADVRARLVRLGS